MPTLLSSVVARSEETLDVALLSYVRAVDSVDRYDAQNPDVWTLTGPGSPRVLRVVPTYDDGLPDRAKIVRVFVGPLLAPGGAYAFGPTASLRLATGVAAPAETLPFTAPTPAQVAAPADGADIARAARGAPDGGLTLLSRVDALKARLELIATATLDAFGHLPGFGSSVQPKRILTPARMVSAAGQMGEQVRADRDVRRAAVSVGPGPAEGIALVTFDVEPTFDARPFRFITAVVANPAPQAR